MNKEIDINYFAQLARIELSDEEKISLLKDVTSILDYVDDIQEVNLESEGEPHFEGENSMREDDEPHDSGMYTNDLLDAAPEREGDYVKVKKIL